MARKRKQSNANASGRGARHTPAPKRAAGRDAARTHGRHPLDPLLLGLAILGILLTGYLTLTTWFGEHPAYCGVDSDCDIVQSSRWSTLIGLPMTLWGLLTYTILAGLVWRLRRRASAWRKVLFFAGIGAGVSWFLTIVSIVEIEATCSYCLASFAIMNALLVLVLLRRPAQMPEHAWGKALPLPIVAVVALVLGLQVHFSGVFAPAVGPEDPYLESLATHLKEHGARFYGAYWCPACKEQKALFTASFERLPYVECTPEGRSGPRAFDCLARDIQTYPTWIIDGKHYTGVVGVERLAELTNFDWSSPVPDATSQR